jgi:hypothetical protein
MADLSGQSHEGAERLTARRVLRARRLREPEKRTARWGLLAVLIAVPLTAAAALALRPAHSPGGMAPQPVAQAAPLPASEPRDFTPRDFTAPAPEAPPHPGETIAVSQAPADPQEDAQSQMLGDWLRVRAAPGSRALHVVYATSGGRFDIRAGDMIVDLCDRPGVESAAEISLGLASDSTACLVIRRGGQLLRATRRPAHADVEGPSL